MVAILCHLLYQCNKKGIILFFKNKKTVFLNYDLAFVILLVFLLIWSLIIGYVNVKDLNSKEVKLSNINEYLLQNTSEKDKIIIYPEGLYLNVINNRESDNKMYSLIPLYVETFGEDLIINRLEITKPEFIIINNYDTSLYYYKEFGKDYAKNIYKWIEDNYKLDSTIEDKWVFKIYRFNK